LVAALTLFTACQAKKKININKDNIQAGTEVKIKGKVFKLYEGSLKLGDNLPERLRQSGFDFDFKNMITFINVVPSIDTAVCEEQSHILGESKLEKNIDRITISRDLPMAQSRFAKEAKLENIRYLSDYKFGNFGKATGLLVHGTELLTRGVLVLDKKGNIQHMQFVSEVTELPDMQKAIDKARELGKQ
jgi:thiol peroxidase